MTSTSHTRIAASGGVVLLTLAVFVLLVSIAQAARPSLAQLERARGGADVTYAAAPLSQLQRAHGGANVTYAAPPLSQLQRAHGGANVAYATTPAGQLPSSTGQNGQDAHPNAAIATLAAPLTQLQRAHGGANVAYAAAATTRGSAFNAVRGGVFIRTKPVAASTTGVFGGIAVAALVIALVAFLALASRPSRRGELAPITSIVQAPSGSTAGQYDEREHKAA